MHLLVSILVVFASLLVVLLVVGLFMRKTHYVSREITINISSQKAFDYVKLLGNQENFNKHAMVAPDREKKFEGTDGTLGYVYSWSGDKQAGEGAKEITGIVEGEKVVMEIRFTKPMKAEATVIMETKPLSENQTKVTWSNAGRLIYPFNIMIPMMEKAVAKDMDSSLRTLKNILEKNPNL